MITPKETFIALMVAKTMEISKTEVIGTLDRLVKALQKAEPTLVAKFTDSEVKQAVSATFFGISETMVRLAEPGRRPVADYAAGLVRRAASTIALDRGLNTAETQTVYGPYHVQFTRADDGRYDVHVNDELYDTVAVPSEASCTLAAHLIATHGALWTDFVPEDWKI